MKKTFTLILTALALVAMPQFAHAEPGGDGELVQGSIDVEIQGGGKVTGTGFDCPNDCSDDASWMDDQANPTVKLTAVDRNAWNFTGWSGCTALPGNFHSCNATYLQEGNTVVAHFRDDQAPSVFLASPADGAVVGDSVLGDVTTSDNDATTKVEYYVDGQPASVRPPLASSWSADIATDQLSEGNHTIVAKAYDATGNVGTTAARNFTVDHTAPAVSFDNPPAATREATPQFSFSVTNPDFKSAECVIQKEDESDGYVPCSPGSWFSADTPAEGDWKFVVRATDNVGNEVVATHRFKVDRTAPELAFTSGPADGSQVDVGNVTYGWTATDATALAQSCTWDDGQADACDGSSSRGLAKGTHAFKVVATDLAGNESTLSRTVVVKADGDLPDPDPGNPDPNDPDPNNPDPNNPDPNNPDPNNPGASDKTAPTVKLSSKKQKLKALKKGLKVKVQCSEACAGTVVAKGKAGVRFAGSVRMSAAGRTALTLKPNRKAKKALKASPRALKLTVTSSLADQAGNRTSTALRTKVRG